MRDTGVAYPPGAEGEGRLVAGTHPRFHPIALLLPFVVRDHRALVAGKREGRLWFRPVYTDYLGSTGLIGPARDAPRLAARWAERAGQSGAGRRGAGRAAAAGARPAAEHGLAVGRARVLRSPGGGPGFGAELRWYPGGAAAPAGAAAAPRAVATGRRSPRRGRPVRLRRGQRHDLSRTGSCWTRRWRRPAPAADPRAGPPTPGAVSARGRRSPRPRPARRCRPRPLPAPRPPPRARRTRSAGPAPSGRPSPGTPAPG